MIHNVLYLNGRPLLYRETGQVCPVHVRGHPALTGVLTLEDLGRTVHPVISVPGLGARRSFGPVVVPAGHYFVMGDNRDVSRDSRYFGLVSRGSILGRAKAVVVSFNLTDKCQPRMGRFLTGLR
jgi:signal peptidase I